MATKRFDKRVNFLMTADEHEMLQMIGARTGLSASDVVRQLVRREYAATIGEQAAKPAKARKRK